MKRFAHEASHDWITAASRRGFGFLTAVVLVLGGVVVAARPSSMEAEPAGEKPGQKAEMTMKDSIYQFSATTITGQEQSLADFKGKVMLIVNTATKCGFTPQFEGLEALYKQYAEQGFVVLGFPCNQFAHQDPGTNAEIASFCQVNYGVSFPMFAKIDVNGSNTHPLFKYLKEQAPGVLGSEAIKWNFTKFLVDKNGKVVRRYAPATKPTEIEQDIAGLLR
jgi:glutathione peroxidase